jgi:NAD(P)-dependent dehydrogenase (short-subunit alcohol dehydrogenase family)
LTSKLTTPGATNGIGFDTAIYLARSSPNHHIIMGARSPTKAATKLAEVQSKNIKGTVSTIILDQDSDDSIFAAVKQLEEEFPHLDILINNAGICLPTDQTWTDRSTLQSTFNTNVFGPMILTRALLPLLKKSASPAIINVTSGLGSIAGLNPELPADHALYSYKDVTVPGYRMSKAALNMLSAYQFKQLRDEGFRVWSYCPGYVATDLTGDKEAREGMAWCESSETSAEGIGEIVRGERDGEVGGFITKKGGRYPW